MAEECKDQDADVIEEGQAVVRLLETTTPTVSDDATWTTPRSPKPFQMIDTIVDFCLEPTPNGRHWKVAPVFGTKTAIDLRTPPSEKPSMTIHHQNAHQYYLRRRRRRRTVYLKHLALDLKTAGTCAVKKKFEQVASAVASAIPDPVSFVVARNVGIPWLSRGLSIRCTWRRNGRRPLTVTCQLVLLMMVVFLFNGAFAMPTLSDSVVAGSAAKVALAATSGVAVVNVVARQSNIKDMFARVKSHAAATAASNDDAFSTPTCAADGAASGGTSKRPSCDLAQGVSLQPALADADPTGSRACRRSS